MELPIPVADIALGNRLKTVLFILPDRAVTLIPRFPGLTGRVVDVVSNCVILT